MEGVETGSPDWPDSPKRDPVDASFFVGLVFRHESRSSWWGMGR